MRAKTNNAMMQDNFTSIKDLVNRCPLKEISRTPSEFSYAQRRLIKAVWCPSIRDARMPQEKEGDAEKVIPHGFLCKCRPPAWQGRWHQRQEDGRRSARPRRQERCCNAGRDATTKGQRQLHMVGLNSSSSGLMKKILRNCLALSSFGFESPLLLCFSFRCIKHMLPHFLAVHCRS